MAVKRNLRSFGRPTCLQSSWLLNFWLKLVTGLGLQKNAPTHFKKNPTANTLLPPQQENKPVMRCEQQYFFKIYHYLILMMTLIIVSNESGKKMFHSTQLN